MQMQLQMQRTWSFALCNTPASNHVLFITIGTRRGLLQVRSAAFSFYLWPSPVRVRAPMSVPMHTNSVLVRAAQVSMRYYVAAPRIITTNRVERLAVLLVAVAVAFDDVSILDSLHLA